jgi:hypothetical protein
MRMPLQTLSRNHTWMESRYSDRTLLIFSVSILPGEVWLNVAIQT